MKKESPVPGHRVAALLFQRTGLLGKDLFHYFPVSLLIMTGVLVFYIAQLLFVTLAANRNLSVSLESAYFNGILAAALAIGLTLSVDEEELNTRGFLDALPGHRGAYTLSKFAAGWVSIAISAILLAPIFTAFNGEGPAAAVRLYTRTFGSGVLLQVPLNLVSILLASGTLITTGMVTGILFGNLAAAGIAAVLFQGTVYSAIAFLLQSSNTEVDLQFGLPIMIANIAWIGIMLFIYKRLFAAARDKTGASVYDDIFKMTRKLFPAKSWSPFREPAGPGINSQHIWYLVGICIAAPVVAGTLHENVVSSSWAAISFALLIGSILGSLMWPSQERNQLNFFSYTLPISRSKVYWSRSAKLILSALGLILAFFTGVVLEISLTGIRSSFDSYVKVGILCAGAIISSAFMAATLSFFTRYKIITTFFSMLLAGQWIWLAYIILSFLQNNYTLFESYSYLAWVIIVSSVLPLATGYFSYSRSPLLELPEAKRSKIATSLFVTLQLWGIFLVAASPCDIAIILFG